LPIGFALTGAKTDEWQVLLDLLHDEHTLLATRPGQILIADKNYYGRAFEAVLADAGLTLFRRPRKGEPDRAGARLFKPLRQTLESIFDTLKGQLDLEHHGGLTAAGGLVRVLQALHHRGRGYHAARHGLELAADDVGDEQLVAAEVLPWRWRRTRRARRDDRPGIIGCGYGQMTTTTPSNSRDSGLGQPT